MTLSEDLLLSIVKTVASRYGEDIAQDIAVTLLKRRNPITHPKRWAFVRAAAKARYERIQWHQPKTINFSDAGPRLTKELRGVGLV